MFISTAKLREDVPPSHKSKIAKINEKAKSLGLDPTKEIPVIVIAISPSVSDSDYSWVLRNATLNKNHDDADRLRAAIEKVDPGAAKKIYEGKAGRINTGALQDELSAKEIAAIIAEFVNGDGEKATSGTASTSRSSKSSATTGDTTNMIDPTDRSALLLALMNFTGLPHAEVDAFLVPASERKVDNSGNSAAETEATGDAPASGMTHDQPTTENQPATNIEQSEISRAAEQATGADTTAPVDNSGAGRDDSSAVSSGSNSDTSSPPSE